MEDSTYPLHLPELRLFLFLCLLQIVFKFFVLLLPLGVLLLLQHSTEIHTAGIC